MPHPFSLTQHHWIQSWPILHWWTAPDLSTLNFMFTKFEVSVLYRSNTPINIKAVDRQKTIWHKQAKYSPPPFQKKKTCRASILSLSICLQSFFKMLWEMEVGWNTINSYYFVYKISFNVEQPFSTSTSHILTLPKLYPGDVFSFRCTPPP